MSRALYLLSYLAVGHRGVGPRTTALSGRPLHRLGSGQRKTEVPKPPRGLVAATGVQDPLPRRRRVFLERRADDLNASASRRPSAFGAVPVRLPGSLSRFVTLCQ
jgi:hypothetical protein